MESVVCHGDLFFAEYGDEHQQDVIRRAAHEAYFGRAVNDAGAPAWFSPLSGTNPYRYLADQVFANPHENEHWVGARLLYAQLEQFQLFDLLTDCCRAGTCRLVHVVRNPLVCLLSLKQARQTGVWREHVSEPAAGHEPIPTSLHVQEVSEYVRSYEAIKNKVRACCVGAGLAVKYGELVTSFDRVMKSVLEFLELPATQLIPQPVWRRLRNYDVRRRILNYSALRRQLPHGLQSYLDDDLI